MKNIPVFKPSIGEEEISLLREVFNSGWIGLGPKTEEFEKLFAKYTGAQHAIALNSCTAALHLAMLAHDIKNGDEVITTPITFASDAEAILYVGATPVFADVQYGTLNIDPKDIERKITNKTKALLIVHYGGHPCDMDEIETIAKKHNLVIIEDASHACGSEYMGQKIGGSKNTTCFSFHAVKNLATGDGGMITTHDLDLNHRKRRLRWMGISKDTHLRAKGGYQWDYDVTEQGFKYHMNDINAAIGIIQLKKLDMMNQKREEIALRYNKSFSELKDQIDLSEIKPNVKSARHNYVVKIKKKDREELIKFLQEKGISAGVHYKPLYLHPHYSKYNKNNTPVADSVWRQIVTLPLYPDMTDEDMKRVINSVREFLTASGK